MEAPPQFETEKKKRKWPKRIAGTFFLLLVLVAGFAWYQVRDVVDEFSAGEKQLVVDSVAPQLKKAPKKELPGLRKASTYLLIGSDARPGDTASRSDTNLIVRIYPKQRIASILSIPRDIWVPIPGHGENRINAAFSYGGEALLAETIREWIGVPIDHFFTVNFESFAGVVDQLDGVYLPIDQRYLHVNDGSPENNWSSIDLQHGYQKLNGEDALSWVRFRHHDSDFHRASRQQIFVREVGRQLRVQGAGDYLPIIKVIGKGTTSDVGMGDLLTLARTLRGIPSERIVRVTMPGTGTTINGASVLLTGEAEKRETLDAWNNPEKLIKDQGEKPPPGFADRFRESFFRYVSGRAEPYTKELSDILDFMADEAVSEGREKRARKFKEKKLEKLKLIDVAPPERPVTKAPYCAPTRLPEGYHFPEGATRSYRLEGLPAASVYATKSSGISIMFMWSRWIDAPILDSPSDAIRLGKRTYSLYWEGATIRMISWPIENGVAWIHNTLQNELSKEEMIGLAKACVSP